MIEDPFKIRDAVPEFDTLVAGFRATSATMPSRHRHLADIAYGPEPRQKLDLFLPERLDRPAPVHIFVHGGYWRAFDRETYRFVAETIVAEGAIAAIVGYTLMPGARMAQLVGEVRQAAAWVHAHVDQHGGDAGQLSASGHSAGAHLCSYLAATGPHEHGFPGPAIRSLLLVSGLYDLRPLTQSFLQAEIGLTPGEVAEWSPFEATQKPDVGITLAVGQKETPPFHSQAQDFAFAASRRGVQVERVTLPGLDHMSIVRDLGTPGTAMAGLLAETIERSRR